MCCILRGPIGKGSLDVAPGGTDFENQVNTLRTDKADLRFYITTVKEG